MPPGYHDPGGGVKTSATMNDVIAGQVELMFAPIVNTQAHIRAGKLRPIATTWDKRAGVLPEVPTVDEAGVPGFEVITWYGMVGPRGLPKDIAERIAAEVHRASYNTEQVSDEVTARALTGDTYRAATLRTGKLVR